MDVFSVLIIVKGRQDHLRTVLSSLQYGSRQPAEVIIVHMNEPADDALDDIYPNVPIKQVTLHNPYPLPLAAARNLAARTAGTDTLIFLDVDCIPAPDCFAVLLADLADNGICMADPYYLSQPVDVVAYELLQHQARPNPARQDLAYDRSDRYELFWSLGFAIRKADFERIGGFDEAFVGYGGEDTDFAFSVRQAGIGLCYSRAKLYHQNHPSYDPPLNWIEDIVTNAIAFKAKWSVWPMEGWLRQFAEGGYVRWDDDELVLLRLPTAAQIAAARKPDAL